MTQRTPKQLLPVIAIIGEAARLHWRHILMLFVLTAFYAPPLIFGLAPAMIEISKLAPDQMQNISPGTEKTLMISVVAVIILSAAIFTLWVRLTLVGARAALFDDAARWPLRIIKVIGLFAVAGLGGIFALLPFGVLKQLLATLAMSFLFAMLSRRLVEACMDIPRVKGSVPPSMEDHLRLAALLAAASFLLLTVETLVAGVLATLGATISAQVTAGFSSVLAITAMASIHAIVYRLRTVPPASI